MTGNHPRERSIMESCLVPAAPKAGDTVSEVISTSVKEQMSTNRKCAGEWSAEG